MSIGILENTGILKNMMKSSKTITCRPMNTIVTTSVPMYFAMGLIKLMEGIPLR